MRKLSVLLAAAAGCLLLASSAVATIPSAANSTCLLEIKYESTACADADLVWSPDGTLDTLCIRVTVRNVLDDPLDSCVIRLDITGTGDSQDELGGGDIGICASTAGSLTLSAMSDANGAVAFDIHGGGCGNMALSWTATAECAVPEVELCANNDTLCVKSPDLDGNLLVDFNDAIPFVTQYMAATGYCGDMVCDGLVDFNDAILFLNAFTAIASCTGDQLPAAVLGDCP